MPAVNPPEPRPRLGASSGELVRGVSNGRRWGVIGLLTIASIVNYFDRSTMSFAIPYFSGELHLDPEIKGVLLSAFFWSYALMQIPVGWCADRFNLRWLYAGAFLIWSVGQGLMGMAQSLTALICFRLVLGVGESIYLPGGSKIVSLLFSRTERGLPSGLFDSGTRIGLVLGGIMVPWMLLHFGWRQTFILSGFSGLLWLVPWFLVAPANLKADRGGATARGAEKPDDKVLGAAGASADLVRRRGGSPWSEILKLLRNRNLVGICLGFFIFDYYWYFLMTWLPSYLVEVRHLTIMKAGLGSALPFLIFGVSEPIGGWIADRLIRAGWDEGRTRKGIVTVAFFFGLFLIPVARVNDARMAVVLLCGACFVGLATGNLLVILQSCAPSENIGLWTGIYNFIGNLAGIMAPLITGFLIKRTGSYMSAFVLAAVMLAAGPLCYWFIVGKLEPQHGGQR